MTGVHPTAIPPTDGDGSCSYRLDADAWADQYDREPRHGEWDCPRNACEGFDCCVFHLTDAKRDEAGIRDGELRTSLLAALDEPGAAPKRLVGANLPELDLSHVLLDAPDNYPVELSHATIDGTLAIDDAAIRQPVYFDHCEIGSLRIGASDLRGVLTFDHSSIDGETVLRDQYDRSIYFRDVTFHGEFTVKPVVFHRTVQFSDSEFHAPASFYADFNDEPQFKRCEFHDDADFFVDINADSYFDDATFHERFDLYAAVNGTLRVRNAEFFGPATLYARYRSDAFFNGATFHDRVGFEKPGSDVGAARFYEYTDFGGVTVEGRADFSNVEFHGSADFSGCTFDGPVTFDDCRFEKRVELTDVHCRTPPTFRDATLTGSPRLRLEAEQPGLVDCTGATVTGGVIETEADADLRYDFTDGTVGRVDLDTGDKRDPLDRYRFYRTDFDGFDFSAHRSELDRNDWHVHELDGEGIDTPAAPNVEGLEVTYNKARNGANETDEDEAAAEFFLREMKYKKRRHAENALAADAGAVARLRAAGRFLSNATLDITCGYGEKPWRVFAASAATVALFALIFAGIGVDAMNEESSLSYLTLSLETFVALVLGTPTIDDPVVNLLTSIEAFLGAFFISGQGEYPEA